MYISGCMKRNIIAAIALLLICFSCEKESVQKVNDLEGSWNWLYSCGGFAGCVDVDKENAKVMMISDGNINILDKQNNQPQLNYKVKDEYESEGFKIFEPELNNGVEWTVKIKEPEMIIITSDFGFSSGYKRM